MRLISYLGPDDDGGTGLLVGDRLIPLLDGPRYGSTSTAGDGSTSSVVGRRALAGAAGIPLDSVDLVAPIPSPGKIVCVGLNYREHVAEGGRRRPDAAAAVLEVRQRGRRRRRADRPARRARHALDLEVELGVVIGRRARRVARADALDHVAGYVVVNDVSARDWQGIPAGPRARARRATASGCGPRAPTRSCRWARCSSRPTRSRIPQALRLRIWRIPGVRRRTPAARS